MYSKTYQMMTQSDEAVVELERDSEEAVADDPVDEAASEMPLIVFESLIQRTTPAMNVPVPRVTMNESIPKKTTMPPLIEPDDGADRERDQDRQYRSTSGG